MTPETDTISLKKKPEGIIILPKKTNKFSDNKKYVK